MQAALSPAMRYGSGVAIAGGGVALACLLPRWGQGRCCWLRQWRRGGHIQDVQGLEALIENATRASPTGRPTVGDLKLQIESQTEIPAGAQVLVLVQGWAGLSATELSDDAACLAGLGVTPTSRLELSARCHPLEELERRLDALDGLGRRIARRVADISEAYVLDSARPELGSGSFGAVLGMHPIGNASGPALAVKVLKKRGVAGCGKSWVSARHLLSELAALSALRHPRIVALHEVLHTADEVAIVLDCVPGMELFDLIVEKKGLAAPTAAVILRQLLDALVQCHAAGVAHRDVKPENVLVCPRTLQTTLIDFGYARFMGAGTRTAATPGGVCLASAMYSNSSGARPPWEELSVICTPAIGTVAYMSFESIGAVLSNQAWSATAADVLKGDVYGAGATAYAMLCCRIPWGSPGRTGPKGLRARQKKMGCLDTLPLPAAVEQSVPANLLDLIRQLMQPVAASRPTAAAAMRHSALQDVHEPPAPPLRPRPPPPPALLEVLRELRQCAASRVFPDEVRLAAIQEAAPAAAAALGKRGPLSDAAVNIVTAAIATVCNEPAADAEPGEGRRKPPALLLPRSDEISVCKPPPPAHKRKGRSPEAQPSAAAPAPPPQPQPQAAAAGTPRAAGGRSPCGAGTPLVADAEGRRVFRDAWQQMMLDSSGDL
eukprot:TRINITY_DN70691_c0_g1_i1.p1 TRINITY_DN70691_c0_g1~~TRINITY_DN70691_c0_g1_i1.p1  ORF type:complete len:691 (+),score=191.40 TRINITY_DN70691_c0_g1_i1:85-2073(+)